MNLTAKILLFAGMVFSLETINNELLSGGFGEGPPETGCVNFLVISGESNINKFSFSYVTPRMPEGYKTNKGAEDERIDFDIPVHRFKASNPRMYDDFLSLLRAEEYPYLRISLLTGDTDRERKSQISNSERISVTIAGVTREYTVDCLVSQCTAGMVLKGIQTVRLTDFGLSPPVRLKGIVKVDNEIDVRFGFIVNFTDQQIPRLSQ